MHVRMDKYLLVYCFILLHFSEVNNKKPVLQDFLGKALQVFGLLKVWVLILSATALIPLQF